MSGPRHLWSGEWRRDSADASAKLARLRSQNAQTEATVRQAPTDPAARRPRDRPSGEPPPDGGAGGPTPWIGIQMQSLPVGGAVIVTVLPGGPADAAGLEPGDVITTIDNRPVNSAADVSAVSEGAIMLANDVSSSMTATDVQPTRLEAAKRAAARSTSRAPRSSARSTSGSAASLAP